MVRVVGIRFQQDGKMVYYDAGELTPGFGDYVVAETDHGLDLGEVILGINEKEEDQLNGALPKIVRMATQHDIQQATDNREKEREAYGICQRKIAEHKLEMKLVSVESTFDNSKMMFYFTANGRVDFRALVKDLASTFRTRIELRQIGVRDEARMLGGLGPCGRPLCCGAFLNDFQPVSIKMAKEQNLSLNPTKISGVCGRLMCCLKYEQDQYETTRKRMPRVGREVSTPDGSGTVTDLNIVKETVKVRIPNGDSTEIREYPLEQISRTGAPQQQTHTGELSEQQSEIKDITASGMSDESASGFDGESETRKETPRRPRKVHQEAASQGGDRFGSRTSSKEFSERKNGESHHNVSDRKSDSRQFPEGNDRPDRIKSSHSRGKNTKEQKYGQPVRRENPDREKKLDHGSMAAQDSSLPQNALKTDSQEKPARNGWAAAVDKALQSAERNDN